MTAIAPARPARRAAAVAGLAAVAVGVVLYLRSGALNRTDDQAWAIALAHDKWWWGLSADLVSEATPSLGGGAALVVLAALLAARSRSWTPLVTAGMALLLLGAVVAATKLLLYQGGVAGPGGMRIPGPRFASGPATTAVVVGGVAALLLRGRLRRLGGVVAFVAVVVLANGAAEIFLGQHRLSDIVASWMAGLAIVGAVALVAGPALRALPDGPALPLLVHLAAGTPLARPAHRAHAWLLLRTGSRVGGRWLDGSRVLVLEVAGWRTGRLRQVPLVYVEHPAGLLVTPANAGRDPEPGWLRSLRAAGSAVVHVRGGPYPVVAAEPQGARREELWRAMVQGCPAAADYARLAGRALPVVLLRPREPDHRAGPDHRSGS